MQIIHKTNREIRIFLLFPCLLGLVLILITRMWYSTLPVEAFIFSISFVVLLDGSWIFLMTSVLITSPEGIEERFAGCSRKIDWKNIERIFISDIGQVYLIFREPVFWGSELINKIKKLDQSDKSLLVSPYLEGVNSGLLIDQIIRYAPEIPFPEFFHGKVNRIKEYQKPGMIGYYYGIWLLLCLLLGFESIEMVDQLFSLDNQNALYISKSMMICMFAGLFINLAKLPGYNRQLFGLDSSEIPHRTRGFFLFPIVLSLLGVSLCALMWIVLPICSITIQEKENPLYLLLYFLSFMIALYAPKVSDKIERLVFKD